MLPLLALLASCSPAPPPRQHVTIVYQALGGVSWPLFIAQEGGYYDKYGLDVTVNMVQFPAGVSMLASGQATMALVGLQQLLPAAAKDESLVAISSWMNRSSYVMVANQGVATIGDLKGKRIAVAQLGDALYGYVVAFLHKYGMEPKDVELLPVGAGQDRRAAALVSGRVDATLVPAPTNFPLEAAGFHSIAALAEDPDIFTTAAFWIDRATLAKDRALIEKLVKAHAEAIARFYADKPFAVSAYLRQDPLAKRADWEQSYDLFAKYSIYERIPLILPAAVASAIDHQAQAESLTPEQRQAQQDSVDNSVVENLQKEHFFDRLFETVPVAQ